jgi:hypothetical protein
MVRFRTLELYPHGYPKKRDQMIGVADAVPHFANLFKDAMLKEDRFRTPGITVEGQKPVFGYFERIDHTAGFGTWARYQSNDLVETLRRGIDAFTLLLSGASDAADDQVIKKLEELVVTPTLKASSFTTQDYKIQPEFVDRIRAERRPVGLNIYLRPSVVDETGITTGTTAMVAAFFTLMGAEYEGE